DLVEFSAFPATRNVTLLNPNASSEKPVDPSTYHQAYYTKESVEQAGPWGPLDPSLPLFFPIPVDASAAQGPVLARFVKLDLSSSAADFDDLNTSNTPNPAGIYVLGTMGSNFNHRYHFRGLKARRCYQISMGISYASAPNLVFRAWGERAHITAGQVWHVPFTEYSKTKQLWNVQFESNGSEAEI